MKSSHPCIMAIMLFPKGGRYMERFHCGCKEMILLVIEGSIEQKKNARKQQNSTEQAADYARFCLLLCFYALHLVAIYSAFVIPNIMPA